MSNEIDEVQIQPQDLKRLYINSDANYNHMNSSSDDSITFNDKQNSSFPIEPSTSNLDNYEPVEKEVEVKEEEVSRIDDSQIIITDVEIQNQEDIKVKKRVTFNDAVEVIHFVHLDEVVERDDNIIEDAFMRIEKEYSIKKKKEIDKYLNHSFPIKLTDPKFILKLIGSVFTKKSKPKLSRVVNRVINLFNQVIKKELFLISPEVFKQVKNWSRKRRLKLSQNKVFSPGVRFKSRRRGGGKCRCH
ncbi:hypothetical protein DFH28DRAFT_937254 [Melampsora americana]|nr:hypothetical protein DFH28DRAFT_937254 [Melampsora americana]